MSRSSLSVDVATLHVSMRRAEQSRSQAQTRSVVAIPKFTYHFSQRKLRNFGHWLLDCLPQVVAILAVAPDAAFLLPYPLRGFHRSTLAMLGLAERQMIPWEGEPVTRDRLLVLESDGRTGGGRPLSSLAEMGRLFAPAGGWPPERPTRRIYVSRRDAKPNRRWTSNEPDVEEVFRRHGFDILCMAGARSTSRCGSFATQGLLPVSTAQVWRTSSSRRLAPT